MNVSINSRPEVENPEIYPFNPMLEQLIRQLHHDVFTIRYHSEITNLDCSVRGTLIGYHFHFGRPFRYVPCQTFLPLFDMDRRNWITIRVDSILFDQSIVNLHVQPSVSVDPKDTIILHCSATYPSMDVGVSEIDFWHRQRGFDGIGYHYVVRLDGTIEEGRPYHLDGAHAVLAAKYGPLGEGGQTVQGRWAAGAYNGIGKNSVIECYIHAIVISIKGNGFYIHRSIK